MAKHYPIRHVANWLRVSESTLRHRGLKSPVTHAQLVKLVDTGMSARWCSTTDGNLRFYRTPSQADDYWVELRALEAGFALRWGDGSMIAGETAVRELLDAFFVDGAAIDWIASHHQVWTSAVEHAIRFESITRTR